MLAREERRADVDRDHDLGAHRLDDVDGQVLDQAAVAQDLAVDLDRREHARHRHAAAHRDVERAAIEHDFLAVDHAGGDGAERNRQPVEGADVVVAPGEAVQQELEILSRQRAGRQSEGEVAETELERDR